MTRFDIYYSVPLGLLNNIVDSASTTPYYNALPVARKTIFVALTDPIKLEVSELKRKRRLRDIYEDFTDIKTHIENFCVEFPDYPNLRVNQIKTTLIICEKISIVVNNRVINQGNFTLLPVANKIKPENYLFYKPALNESVLIITINNETKLKQFVGNLADSELNILFYFLAKLNARGASALVQEQYVLVHRLYRDNLPKITSLLQLSSICDGKVIHTPVEVNRIPSIIDKSGLGLQRSYTQYLDSISIFSEYNYEKDILNKYLRLYHVIENFMYKKPIVELMDLYHGNMFSIRNFKTLYSKVDKKEQDALDAFFRTVFAIHRAGAAGITLKQSIQALWSSLPGLPGYVAADIDTFLSHLKIPYTAATAATNGNILDFYCKLIYFMRNSIVHNKETEHHILHSTLNPVVPFILVNFLFPSIEEICLKLIIETNSNVNYTQPYLKLYQE